MNGQFRLFACVLRLCYLRRGLVLPSEGKKNLLAGGHLSAYYDWPRCWPSTFDLWTQENVEARQKFEFDENAPIFWGTTVAARGPADCAGIGAT